MGPFCRRAKPPLPTAGQEEAKWGWEEEEEEEEGFVFLALGVLFDLGRLGTSVAESQRPKRGPFYFLLR